MSRPLHIEFNNAFYHVAARGINKQALFLDAHDSNVFIRSLRKLVEKFNLRLYAFCLMTNHYHLYLSTPDANLSKAIKALNQNYAIYFLSKYQDKDGKVFKNRYMRKLVQDDLYSKTLIAYIHNNPKKLVKRLEDWEYSSYPSYCGTAEPFNFIDYDWVWQQFSNNMSHFTDFHQFLSQREWTPEQHSRYSTFLASSEYIQKIKSQYINFELINEDEVPGVKDLKRTFNEHAVLASINSLGLSKRFTEKLKIYFLREFAQISLKCLGLRFNQKAKNISKIHLKFRQAVKTDASLANIVLEILKKANCET